MFGKLGRKMDFKSIRKIGKNPLTRYCCLNFSMVPVDFGKKKAFIPMYHVYTLYLGKQ